MLDIILDTLLDSVKLLPFLFLTYLCMELLEHHTNDKTSRMVEKAGKSGPIWGGLLGVIPQCGFSTAAASLYSGGVITVGTLLAIFLSTSDEMLPIFISEAVPIATIGKILATKVGIAIVSGLLVELAFLKILNQKEKHMDIHVVCEEEHCHCEDGVLLSAIKHTLRIFIYIILISFVLNLVIAGIGEDTIASALSSIPVLGDILAALIGLIPNCASSVILTELYLDGLLGAGAMMAGLLVNAGVGLLVLFRLNRHLKENLAIVTCLYSIGVFWGIVLDLVGITFY